jgi:hypothetical protein
VRHRAQLVILLLLTAIPCAIPQSSAVWITHEQEEGLLQGVRAVLPPGWTITNSMSDRTPDDWYTLDHRGFEIDGAKAGDTFQIWFLPKDWLGIRQFRPNRSFSVYWEGVLAGSEWSSSPDCQPIHLPQGLPSKARTFYRRCLTYKTITDSDDVPVHEALQRLGMSTPSLVNGGWAQAQTVFKGQLAEVDEQTQLLVDQFCRDRFCREEAAYSLIVLGVPSHGLTLDCAEHATGKAQEFCVSALKYWGGGDSVRILNAVVSDPASSPQVQKYAAIALEDIADPSSASALMKSLGTTSSSEAAVQAAEALARIHYKLAAPLILSRMRTEQSSFFQALYAGALASLQYKPAAAVIERLCKTTTLSADWILQEQRDTNLVWLPEIALMRLTAPWGTPSNGIRLLLLASANSVLPGPIQVAIVIENVGDQDSTILGTSGNVIVDGKTYGNKDPVIVDGDYTLRVNGVAVHAIDLTGLITNPGIHSVEYRRGTAISNQLTLQILNR